MIVIILKRNAGQKEFIFIKVFPQRKKVSNGFLAIMTQSVRKWMAYIAYLQLIKFNSVLERESYKTLFDELTFKFKYSEITLNFTNRFSTGT
jgi:hypothetical protein